MLDFMQFIEQTNAATTSDDIFHLFEKALKQLGFDSVLYSLMTDHASMGKKAGHGVVRNYPEYWMKHYAEKKYQDIDPVRRHVMLSSQPFVWDKMGKIIPYTREEKRLLNESTEAGLLHGVGLGIHCINGESVGLGFACSNKDVDMSVSTLSMIKALANQFHFAYTEFHKAKGSITPEIKTNLTRREREVLQWCSCGKTLGEIATIMGISENSVDYYIRNTFSKLEVNNKVLAVVKAIKHQLIEIPAI